MNTKIKTMVVVLAATGIVFFNSCKKESEIPAKPVITIHELGEGDSHGNDHTAKINGELHMDIDIIAEGKIDIIQVRIHPEGLGTWELDTIFTKFSGLKNTTFHEHVIIGSTAEAGPYHFDFIVTDMYGNQSSAEAELQIVVN